MSKRVKLYMPEGEMLRESGWVDIIRVGNWENSHKEFKLELEDLQKMLENFRANVLGYEDGCVQFNYSHDSWSKAAGWIKDLQIENGVLQARVEFTEEALDCIKNQEYRYVSAEINFNYCDEESGEKFGATLIGAALTNIPFVKRMRSVQSAFVELSEKEQEASYLFSKPHSKMEKFNELCASFAETATLSAAELEKVKGAFAMLSEDEQAEAKAKLEELEQKAEQKSEAETPEEPEEAEQSEAIEPEAEEVEEQKEQNLSEGTVSMADFRKLQAELDRRKAELDTLDVDAKLTTLSTQGHVTPAAKDKARALMLSMKESQRKDFVEFLSTMPKVTEHGVELGHGKDVAKTKKEDGFVETLSREIMKTTNAPESEALHAAMKIEYLAQKDAKAGKKFNEAAQEHLQNLYPSYTINLS